MVSFHDSRSKGRRHALVFVLAAFFFAQSFAWTYVPVSDENMVHTSHSIVIGVVEEELDSGSIETGGIYRHYKIQPTEELKGTGKRSAGESLLVHVNGGLDRESNRTLVVPGAPAFVPGQNVLLFLHESEITQLSHFALGAFYQVSASNKRDQQFTLAVRRHEIEDAMQDRAEATTARDFDKFTDYIRRVVSGGESVQARDENHSYLVEGVAPADLLNALEETQPTHLRYKPLNHYGRDTRWVLFDRAGGQVAFRRHKTGMVGLKGKAVAETTNCMNSWNNNPNSPVKYVVTGTTTNIKGLKSSDLINTILYEDPGNVIAGSFSCKTGGVLAVGGYYPYGTHSFRGKTWNTIIEADIIHQNGIQCYLDSTSDPIASYESILTHEMGHTLGLDHSCLYGIDCKEGSKADKAIMRSAAHINGGRFLGEDDVAGIQYLYSKCHPNCPPAPVTTRKPPTPVTTGQRKVSAPGDPNEDGDGEGGEAYDDSDAQISANPEANWMGAVDDQVQLNGEVSSASSTLVCIALVATTLVLLM